MLTFPNREGILKSLNIYQGIFNSERILKFKIFEIQDECDIDFYRPLINTSSFVFFIFNPAQNDYQEFTNLIDEYCNKDRSKNFVFLNKTE